ncbi:outer membrane protein [Candidatus Odyssella acanthamoebae]|uniref:Outer membrane protein beta-barrel domain-containing protein n=1 Tax=Candidatus Odyssella acanthamoebae TaxID=91604 RepID=A0A077ATT6_9PROT|nr:outer membrane beta-barrel protein [Candidatus Paracaedibacter acanthamoebae]AIK95806.1 hypothetical protein ID47_02230 [Candidatus Paracaedibacter acanthamoebae]
MKKILSTAVAVAALASAADAKGFNGAYIGMDFGISNLNSTVKVRPYSGGTGDNAHGKSTNPILGVNFGYAKVFSNCFSLGGEVIADFTFNNKKTLSRIDIREVKSKRDTFGWGLLAKFGMQINPKSLVFVGFGVKSQSVKYIYTEKDATPFTFSAKHNKVRPAYQVGFKTLLPNDAVALNMSYTLVQGAKKTKGKLTSPNFVFNPGYAVIKNNDHQVKLGISYHF